VLGRDAHRLRYVASFGSFPLIIPAALRPPYVLAFTSSCVEVWHIETGVQVQVIPGVNVRLLCEGTRPSNIAEKYTDGVTLEEVLMVSGDSVLVLRSVSENV
jgi:hypothetical protein